MSYSSMIDIFRFKKLGKEIYINSVHINIESSFLPEPPTGKSGRLAPFPTLLLVILSDNKTRQRKN